MVAAAILDRGIRCSIPSFFNSRYRCFKDSRTSGSSAAMSRVSCGSSRRLKRQPPVMLRPPGGHPGRLSGQSATPPVLNGESSEREQPSTGAGTDAPHIARSGRLAGRARGCPCTACPLYRWGMPAPARRQEFAAPAEACNRQRLRPNAPSDGCRRNVERLLRSLRADEPLLTGESMQMGISSRGDVFSTPEMCPHWLIPSMPAQSGAVRHSRRKEGRGKRLRRTWEPILGAV